MGKTPRLVLALAAAALTATSLVSCTGRPGPEAAVNGFLDGWRAQKFAPSLALISGTGGSVTGDTVATQIKTMSGDLAAVKPTLKAGKAKVDKDDATVPIDVSWPIENGVTWSYQTTLRLHYSDKTWHPIFEPSVIEPDLTDTATLAVKTTQSKRGDILGGDGQPIVSDQPVVHVGIHPKDIVGDPAALIATVNAALKTVNADVDPTDLLNRVKAAQPDAFVDVVTLRQAAYLQIKPRIHELNGTMFITGTAKLAPSRVFAAALLGKVGDVTKERMDAKPGKYQIGDQVGFGGIEEAYDDLLRGSPGVSVVIPGPKTNDGTSGQDKVLFHKDPVDGKSVKTTIDVKTQNAADQALATVTQPASIVAIQISTGNILAVANGPDATGNDLALNAQVPPGSMFKTVTATNLLEAGKITVDTPVPCPDTLDVGGFTIHNAEPEGIGNAAPLHLDFAKSCNTAFAKLGSMLGPTGLADTAKQLGVGIPWDLGIDAYTGSVSANGDAAEQAAAAFGQGKTQVSPVIMAGMAAAVNRGQWKQPHLLLDPAPAKTAPDQPALKPATVTALQQMMREVVTNGTGVKVNNVPGPPISGKTGTAEHDNKPTPTHSWFMGFRGDVAFAVFVQDGGMSTDAAVPLSGTFFRLLG
jgi:cell division protein FtsI/penicillin-binding protein 2